MASLRDIRRNIKSVKSTQQITYAMKMVAAARIRKAQTAILSSRPFALKMEQLIEDLQGELDEEDIKNTNIHTLFAPRQSASAVGLVLVTSDKGLCGSFNTNLLKAALAWLKMNENKKIYLFLVGKKGRDFVRRLKGLDIEVVTELVGIFPRAGYVHAEMLGSAVMENYINTPVQNIGVIYNEFKSMLNQRVVQLDILPLQKLIAGKFGGTGIVKNEIPGKNDFLFEPGKKALLEALIPRYIKAEFYRILLESQAAELSARMSAMESASKNARDIIEALTLKLNMTRQSMITRELSEIVSGAESLKG